MCPVECWYTPLQWLCQPAGYWQELKAAIVYTDPEHPRYAQWLTCLVSMLAMQELDCFQLPRIVYKSLQHEAIFLDVWHNNGPSDVITVSLWIQNITNKICLCSYIANTCPHHNPTATMGQSTF